MIRSLPILFAILLLAVPVSAAQVLTTTEFSTSGTWSPPSGVTTVSIDITAGGAGGSAGGYGLYTTGSSQQSVHGTGGEAGVSAHYDGVTVVPGTLYTINIGTGGTANSSWTVEFSSGTAVNRTWVLNGTSGTNTSAFGYQVQGGRGWIRNASLTYNTVSGWSVVYAGNAVGGEGSGTAVIAESGGTAYGTCEQGNGITGSSGGNGYGAGGGGGAEGTWETGNIACQGGSGGAGAPGYVKITYFVDSSTTTAWYSQQLVQLKIIDAYKSPIPLANISVNYIASSLPSTNASFLVDAFGVSTSVAELMLNSSVAMMGDTDSDGSLSFMMFPALKYGVTIVNETLGVSNYIELSPKEEFYTIICPKSGQAATDNRLNSSYTIKLPFYQLNSSGYYNLSMIYQDLDGLTCGLVFTVYDHSNGDVVMYTHDWGDPTPDDLIVDNYTAYVPFGREYIWEYNASRGCPAT